MSNFFKSILNLNRFRSDEAIEINSKIVTYDNLEVLILKTIKQFQKIGIKEGNIVSCFCPRNEYYCVIVLALLRMKAIFLPLDIHQPVIRVKKILEEVRPFTTIIFDSKLKNELGSCLFIDYEKDLFEIHGKVASYSKQYDNLMYIIYTSGTTGKPKGVEISRNAFQNFYDNMLTIFQLNSKDIFLFLTSISFDISLFEFLVPLSIGAKVYIVGEKEKNPYFIGKRIKENNISILQLTPSLMELLITYQRNLDWMFGVKKILLGGEDLPLQLLKKIKMHYKGEIYNLYGPTEATIWCSYENLTDSNFITIGKFFEGVKYKLYEISSDYFELILYGRQNMSGYHNELSSTATEYRTGDLFRKHGNKLVFVGRNDSLIKLNGYRIDLSEINDCIKSISSIKSSVTLYDNLNKRIISFCIGESDVTRKDILLYLKKVLPNYMIPTDILFLNEFPLTINKKINKLKLLEEYTQYEKIRSV